MKIPMVLSESLNYDNSNYDHILFPGVKKAMDNEREVMHNTTHAPGPILEALDMDIHMADYQISAHG